MMALLLAPRSHAGSLQFSADAPTVDGLDIAEQTWVGTDKSKVWTDADNNGQTFTTSSEGGMLTSFTVQSGTASVPKPTKVYIFRVGTVVLGSPNTFTEVANESATQTVEWPSNYYMTFVFETPVELSPDTLYGVDFEMDSSTTSWSTGIPYIRRNRYGDATYTGGTLYTWDKNEAYPTIISIDNSRDHIFHLNIEAASSSSGGTAFILK